MSKIRIEAFIRSRYPLAIAAGLLLAASFPEIGIAGFAWVAPGLMLAAALGTSGARSFRLGYVAGLAHYLASLHWLLLIPVTGFPILGWLALSAFLALFPAAWVWLGVRLSGIGPANLPQEGEAKPLELIRAAAKLSWARRVVWAVSCAMAWVALEMIIARIFGGFPWNLLGASQYRILPLIQVASLTGIYGVSFLVAWSSVSLLCAAVTIIGNPGRRSPWMAEIILPLAAVMAAFVFGFHRLENAPASNRELNVTLVQPSIPQTLIWDPQNDFTRFQELLRLSDEALTNKTDLLIWPEAATPGLPRYDVEMGEAILNLARRHHVWMIIGADDASVSPTATNYYNASFLISPDGHFADIYRKRSLVIFGEYIPLEKTLPFIKWFTPVTGSYTAGTNAEPFRLGDLHAQTSVLICFEDVFPRVARDSVDRDTDFLVNITNDGWFGKDSAQWQQAASAVFRAVENGVPLIRCANTGLSCWVDANGRIRDLFRDQAGTVYGRGVLTFKLPLPRAGQQNSPTFFHEHGEWLGWLCVAFTGWFFVRMRLTRRNRTIPPAQ